VIITITDNGPGITTDNLAHVFDPFFTTKAKGTGLGLSVCQQLINLHQGNIKLESTEGKSTTVTIVLPLKRIGDNCP
jgi:signal transduction histidine kinase